MRHMQQRLTQRVRARIDTIDDIDTLARVEDDYRWLAGRSTGSWRRTFLALATYAHERLYRTYRCDSVVDEVRV